MQPMARPGLRLRVRDVGVGRFQTGTATVYRVDGKRVSLLRFRVQDRDEAEALAEVNRRRAPIILPPYRVEWLGR